MFEVIHSLCQDQLQITYRGIIVQCFSIHEEAGFAPSIAIVDKPKKLPKKRNAVSPLSFGEERTEKKTSFTQVFFFFPRPY